MSSLSKKKSSNWKVHFYINNLEARNASATNICTNAKKKMEEWVKIKKLKKVGNAKCAHNELANANTKMFIEGKASLRYLSYGNLSVIKWKTMNNTSQQNKVVWQAIEHNMMNSEVKHGEHPNVTWKTIIGCIYTW